MSNAKVARCICFAGQGSQWVGMGKRILEKYPQTKVLLDEVDSTMGYSLSNIMISGSEKELRSAINCQVGVFTYSAMLLKLLNINHGINFVADNASFVMGHSLGEFTALYASSSLSLRDTILILKQRASLTMSACESVNGGMSAVLFCPISLLEQVTHKLAVETGGICEITNINSPTQLVVSGDRATLKLLPDALHAEKEGRRVKVKEMNVSCPFHSQLLRKAAEQLDIFMRNGINSGLLKVSNPVVPVISNVDGSIMKSSDDIIKRIGRQLASPVLFKQCILEAVRGGVKQCVEIGPRPVLSSLIKSIDPEISTLSICDESKLSEIESI